MINDLETLLIKCTTKAIENANIDKQILIQQIKINQQEGNGGIQPTRLVIDMDQSDDDGTSDSGTDIFPLFDTTEKVEQISAKFPETPEQGTKNADSEISK